ncbi:SDR family NAD(P)-dependent oxidoreductase [Catellatospora tritici]|uniref:SDR family NAD(P)-dependent oxidoreductase n=1 Tax=Catellatospora tritici TaxID=2851566 RepID=UPI001C2D6B55|nr:SDR family oxidoreductase [Catellatospora tritici]MBV1852120.1 SDR family oxidoreductase [Catellatospora tritici]
MSSSANSTAELPVTQAEPAPDPQAEGGNRTAVVTGATAGIGRAFAVRLASDGWDLVLVARDEARLAEFTEALSRTYGVRAGFIAADLATPVGCELVEARLKDTARPVDLLVNNAGLSLNTPFLKSTVEKELHLLAVNVQAVMRLTLAVLPGMVARRRGDVINVSSVAGFGAAMPGSTYPASKAWVTNFSESVALSVAHHGVRVLALCPGFTRTEFHERAGINMTKTPDWMWLQAPDVVSDALRDLRRGRTVSVPNWKYKVVVSFMRHTPTRLLRRLARGARVRTGRDTEGR